MHIFFFCHKYYLPLKIIFNEQNFYLSIKLFSDGLLQQYNDNIFFCGKNIFDMKIQPFVIVHPTFLLYFVIHITIVEP